MEECGLLGLAALDTILFTNQHLIIEALCARNIGAGGRGRELPMTAKWNHPMHDVSCQEENIHDI